ncbi:bifunctional (2E,6E)-farnesyl diphosphate synthase/dimethylallyltranstransferase [Starmerella bacillaris]|uniref:Farnesyl pyrophosphate synthase n=1 Tax=Starmerella bacillaris TaxID=1247836 RepID=A0AAV5RIJ7_STABA|nr:bifunctional (2E,6E)-farnesyl diphosphate synthase/dimethylallyltranstransferase [Starmerella bacillaris]
MSSITAFENVLPEIIDEILTEISETNLPDNGKEWIKQALTHNCMGGKLNRGLSVLNSYQILTAQKELSAEEFKRAAVLGWLVELLQAFFLVADDIMDASHTRRGQPCWYRMPDVGMVAINDAFIIESTIYMLLKKYFKSEKYYVDLVELFHEITLFTELGQLVDLITAPEDNVDLSKFSLDKHTYIVTYKTAYYSFYLPVVLALHMAGKASKTNLSEAKRVLIPIGVYFQVQDDYLDLYGDPKITGKIGTDIQDNKCGWLINVALELANAEDRAVLDANYGRKDPKCEQKVKDVYTKLDIKSKYHDYEESVANDIRNQIAATDESEGLKKEVFSVFFDKIYKRQK